METRIRRGSCPCGAVRCEARGEPLRVAPCRCAECRKESGAAFVPFAVWSREAFSSEGEIGAFAGRSSCPRCGGRLSWLREDEAELRSGSPDGAPTDLAPVHENWTGRRERWLHPLPGRVQFAENRPETG